MSPTRIRKAPRKRRVVLKRSGERRERFSLLLLLSFLIHATLILLLALTFARQGDHPEKPEQKSEATPPPPPEVTLELPPPETPERPILEAQEIAEKAPEKAPFQSDQNTAAASELPSTGSAPVPTQQGVNQAAMELQTQSYTPGEHAAINAGAPATSHPPSPPAPPMPQQKQAQEQPNVHPSATPAPTSSPTPSATPSPTATAAPTPQSSATPQPTPLTPPPPNSVRLLELPKEEPNQQAPEQTVAQKPTPQTPQQSAPPLTSGSQKGYQRETRQTVIMGNISNRGRSSVAAVATPLGRYHKTVADAIGSRWYYYVDQQMGLISIGTVNVSFKVTSSGKVMGLKASSNSNQSLTDCWQQHFPNSLSFL